MPTDAAKRATIDRYLQTFCAADRDGWLALFTADAEAIDPVGMPANVGHEAIGAFFDRARPAGMTMIPAIERVAICGNEALLVFRMNALFGETGGMAVDIVDIFELDDDAKIKRLRAYWDTDCMHQLDGAAAKALLA